MYNAHWLEVYELYIAFTFTFNRNCRHLKCSQYFYFYCYCFTFIYSVHIDHCRIINYYKVNNNE